MNTTRLISKIIMLVLCLGTASHQALSQQPTRSSPQGRRDFRAQAGPTLVTGAGTIGRIAKWRAFNGTNYIIGDSVITESLSGNIGIGTASPGSKLSVMGLIESAGAGGGLRFPDGTIQTTAALSANQVVRSLNGLMGNLTLSAGPNITITPGGGGLTISATGLLNTVTRNSTLAGNGSAASPLGVAVPLVLSGTTAFTGSIITATNGGPGNAVRGSSTDGIAIFGSNTSGEGVRGSSTSNVGVRGESATNVGVFGLSTSGTGMRGRSTSGIGIQGESTNSFGISGSSTNGVAISGTSAQSVGVNGQSTNSHGVQGQSLSADAADAGVVGFGLPGGAFAGRFQGNVHVSGTLSKGGGSFKIDHPLDPENKYLYHSFVESPDMMNIYNGNITTDENGDAEVGLPDWFEALNKDFRYQLTVVGTFAQAIVADEVSNNRFQIKTSAPGVKVSWQVTGIRRDAFANRYRIKVEEEKPERERGYFLHPEAFDQPEERSVEWARDPARMQQIKQRRVEAEQARGQQKQLGR
jgi:hypothetical protein